MSMMERGRNPTSVPSATGSLVLMQHETNTNNVTRMHGDWRITESIMLFSETYAKVQHHGWFCEYSWHASQNESNLLKKRIATLHSVGHVRIAYKTTTIFYTFLKLNESLLVDFLEQNSSQRSL
jgi:hypothetical protein